MTTGLLHLHSLLRWVALISLVIMIYRAYSGMINGRAFSAADNRWSLITVITFHTQLILGFALYVMNGWHTQMGNMGDGVTRFFAIEHLMGMVIAIALVTVGRARAKKTQTDSVKFKRHLWAFIGALLIVLISIPWPFLATGAGRSWFPGM